MDELVEFGKDSAEKSTARIRELRCEYHLAPGPVAGG